MTNLSKKYLTRNNYLLLLIIVIGLLLRLYKISSPLLDLYPVRQEMNAMLARSFFRNGINIFNPQADFFGSGNPYFVLQFPLIEILSAIGYYFVGLKECVGRFLSVLFSLGSIVLLYKTVKLLFEENTALLAAFLLAVLPISLYFGRTFMCESPMIFFSIGIVLSAYHWLVEGKKIWAVVCGVFSAIAFLTKIPTVYMLAIVIYLAYLRNGFKFILKKDFFLFLILSVMPALLWYSLMMSEHLFGHVTEISTLLSYLTWNKFYLRIFESFAIFILTPLGIPLFIMGFLMQPNHKVQGLVYVWFCALLFYLFRTPDVNAFHYYYQLPFVPVVCIFIARALSKMLDHGFWRGTIFSNFKGSTIVLVVCGIIAITSFVAIQPFYKWNRVTYNVGKFIEANTPASTLLIAGRCTQEGPLYYTDRKGWIINESGILSYIQFYKGKDFPKIEKEIDLVEFLITKGADLYFTTNIKAFKSDRILEDYMHSHFEILKQGEGFIIFDLNKRKG